ncbi:MAG TPA: ComEC/Rec2 family competence protein [Candidatus Saccharimonadales bacterium]|nr:ComEC/Rec2 family competence protein [Candidatus Saccharimonadales bacterium]
MTLRARTRAGRAATWIWGGFAVGCGAGFAGSVRPSLMLPLGIGAAGGGLLAASISRRCALPAVVAGAVAMGLVRGSLSVAVAGPATIDGNLGARPVVLIGTVRSADPGAGSTAIVDIAHLSDIDTDRAVSGAVLISGPLIPALSPGDQVEIDASGLRRLNRRPGATGADTLEREGVEGMATSPQVFVLAGAGSSPATAIVWVQERLIGAVNAELPEPAAGLLLGIAFGIHQPLSADVRAPLQDAGLIHIVVVSGLKVVLIIGLLSAVARVFEWSRRRTVLIALPVVAAYVLVSGAGPAATRSALMAGAAMLASTGGRRTDPVPMLALVAALMLGLSPALVEDPGFQLSFLGTAGILTLATPIAARLPGPRMLAEPFAMTLAAQVATLPIMAGIFGVIAFGGPIANALVLPLLPVMIVAGGFGAALSALHPGLGWIPLQFASLGVWVTTTVARLVSAIPGAAVQIGSWPAVWSVAEGFGLVVACAVLMTAMRRTTQTRA